MMHATGLLKLIFPSLSTFLGSSSGKTIYQFLAFVDKIHQNRDGIKLERAVLISCLLFPIMEREIKNQYIDQGIIPTMGHVLNASQTLIKMVVASSFAHFPKAMSGAMGYIMQIQYKFTPPSGKRHYRTSLFHHKEFQMALKFLKLRSLVDESLTECYTTWTKAYKHYRTSDEHKGHRNPAPIVREAQAGS
jgi:poly(A) polymerase